MLGYRLMLNRINSHRNEVILVLAVLIISGIAHGYNMFNFPYYESDEGTYLSQAWSVISLGKLAPYTYWYDHAPAGWIFVSLWSLITRGVFSFGFSINSGRVFMLVIHLASTLLTILIAKKLTRQIYPGVIAALIFSFSPLGVYFQRRLLLDNIMIFWVLASYYLILGRGRKLSHYVLSSFFLGIAILSKENAVFFIPGLLFTVFRTASVINKRFAIAGWLIVFSSIVGMYLLFAFLKSELFPYGTVLGGESPHVSLIETLRYQGSRSGGSILRLTESSFWENFMLWIRQDFFVISLGIISNIVLTGILVFRKKYIYIGLNLLAIFFWMFLLRGGIVIEFYITPLIPIFGLLIGVTVYEVVDIFGKIFTINNKNNVMMAISMIIIVFYLSYGQVSRAFAQTNKGLFLYKNDQTKGQIQAVDWIRENIDSDAVIVIDNYSYLDLHSLKNPSGIVFPNAHYYWKVDQDIEIRDNLLKNSPESIDFIARTPQMATDLLKDISPLTTEALANSKFAKGFNTDGWGVEIWATTYPGKILDRSWNSYKRTFLRDGNRSIDPNQNNITTSEGQSYVMLRSVWMDDKSTFDKTWDWTRINLKNQNDVFGWKWGKESTDREGILDPGSATDADTDIALALIFAYKKWGDQAYMDSAKSLLTAIWVTDVKYFRGAYYIIPGNWAMGNRALTINPSYISPYAYRIFAQVDTGNPWSGLIDTSYEVLKGCMTSPLFAGDNPVYLPPNWCQMDENGVFSRAEEPGLESTDYSYDAVRTMWRLALDFKWNLEPRAKELLDLSGKFLLNKWKSDGKILVGYTHAGDPWEEYESVLGYSMNLTNFSITSPKTADSVYKGKIFSKFYEDFDRGSSYWEDPNNYYVQNWAWFGTALYSNKLPNLWRDK